MITISPKRILHTAFTVFNVSLHAHKEFLCSVPKTSRQVYPKDTYSIFLSFLLSFPLLDLHKAL